MHKIVAILFRQQLSPFAIALSSHPQGLQRDGLAIGQSRAGGNPGTVPSLPFVKSIFSHCVQIAIDQDARGTSWSQVWHGTKYRHLQGRAHDQDLINLVFPLWIVMKILPQGLKESIGQFIAVHDQGRLVVVVCVVPGHQRPVAFHNLVARYL